MARLATLGLIMGLLVSGQAVAQPLSARPAPSRDTRPASDKAGADAPKTPAEDTPAYEAQLLRLSELLGRITYLRDLCGAGDGSSFRKQMAGLLESEGGDPRRRERYIGAFNFGYRGYERTYVRCTSNAQLIIKKSLAEAGRIARDIPNKYAQ